MAQAFKVIIERDTQGGYVATFPELLGRQAQATSLKILMERIREATAPSPDRTEPATATRIPPVAARDGPGTD